jgi:hypothetical protein
MLNLVTVVLVTVAMVLAAQLPPPRLGANGNPGPGRSEPRT